MYMLQVTCLLRKAPAVLRRTRLPATHLAGLLRVKHVDQVQAEVALQPQHVVGAAVQHLCDGGAGQGLRQQVQVIAQGQRVNDVVLGTCEQRGGSG
jgi:hypothetical protein